MTGKKLESSVHTLKIYLNNFVGLKLPYMNLFSKKKKKKIVKSHDSNQHIDFILIESRFWIYFGKVKRNSPRHLLNYTSFTQTPRKLI